VYVTLSVQAVVLSINCNGCYRHREVMHMSDYEILSLGLAIGMLVLAIIAICRNTNK